MKGGRGTLELLGKNIRLYHRKELEKLIGYVPQIAFIYRQYI